MQSKMFFCHSSGTNVCETCQVLVCFWYLHNDVVYMAVMWLREEATWHAKEEGPQEDSQCPREPDYSRPNHSAYSTTYCSTRWNCMLRQTRVYMQLELLSTKQAHRQVCFNVLVLLFAFFTLVLFEFWSLEAFTHGGQAQSFRTISTWEVVRT